MKLKTERPVQCTNCQRAIAEGESVHSPDQDALNRGDAICGACRPFGKEKPAEKTAEEKQAEQLAAKQAAELKKAEEKAAKDAKKTNDGKPEG